MDKLFRMNLPLLGGGKMILFINPSDKLNFELNEEMTEK